MNQGEDLVRVVIRCVFLPGTGAVAGLGVKTRMGGGDVNFVWGAGESVMVEAEWGLEGGVGGNSGGRTIWVKGTGQRNGG